MSIRSPAVPTDVAALPTMLDWFVDEALLLAVPAVDCFLTTLPAAAARKVPAMAGTFSVRPIQEHEGLGLRETDSPDGAHCRFCVGCRLHKRFSQSTTLISL
eukprot:COSAG01_NODE_34628_length_544_cov_1.901124_1_plen_101_part_01